MKEEQTALRHPAHNSCSIQDSFIRSTTIHCARHCLVSGIQREKTDRVLALMNLKVKQESNTTIKTAEINTRCQRGPGCTEEAHGSRTADNTTVNGLQKGFLDTGTFLESGT